MSEVVKNVLLFWDQEALPTPVQRVVGAWRDTCPGWSVSLFSARSAEEYLSDRNGGRYAELFRSCALPAMKSDFFRLAWVLREGGLYCDLNFAPRREPGFVSTGHALTVCRWPHGRIVNGVFYAPPCSPELGRILEQVAQNIEQRTSNNVWEVTGPGAWIKVLEPIDPLRVKVIDREELMRDWIQPARHDASGRGTDRHWSEVQKRESIFADA